VKSVRCHGVRDCPFFRISIASISISSVSLNVNSLSEEYSPVEEDDGTRSSAVFSDSTVLDGCHGELNTVN